jgi:uncharacterized protein
MAMHGTLVRFYAELNDFILPAQRYRACTVGVEPALTIGGLIERSGVPLEQVDLVLQNGEPVPFTAEVHEGDRVAVYPVFESFDISSLQHLRSKPLRTPRFVLDVHLGKLASFLRMLGFDSLYRGDYRDEELVRISLEQRRALLSKDRALLAAPILVRSYAVRSDAPLEQTKEVIRRFDLADSARPFTRCLRCNAPLECVRREDVARRLPHRVREMYDEFQRCPSCNRVYWRGTHFTRMSEVVKGLLAMACPEDPHN